MTVRPDYNAITESPGLKASKEQLARIYHRYNFADGYTATRDVLEVACGSGIGLGFLAQRAKSVVGGDIDKKNIDFATALYKNTPIQIQEIDAHSLPFKESSFDVVLLFEAIYYLVHPETFVQEAFRVLRPKGLLIICTVNKDWADFHPSPFTHQYFSVPQLGNLLKIHFGKVEFYGAFSTVSSGLLGWGVSLLKRLATRFHLIPGSLAARAYLKRIFIGPLQPLPERIHANMVPYAPSISIPGEQSTSDYKIIYAVGRK